MRGGEDDFYQNVKTEVIPRLIAKDLLHGKKEKGKQLVEDDEALARMLTLGAERFVYNQQGYSFMVVRAPLEAVAKALRTQPGVAKYNEKIKAEKMQEDVGIEAAEGIRHTFLLQMRESPDWTVLVQTVHWFQSCDAVMVTALAAALSKSLNTIAAGAWDDDFSGSSMVIYEKGKQQRLISDESEDVGWEEYYLFFYEEGIVVPEAFIGAKGKAGATLHLAEPNAVDRADYALLSVPEPLDSETPHVFEKIGMMAKAIAEEDLDEESFMEGMLTGITAQAEALVVSGKFVKASV